MIPCKRNKKLLIMAGGTGGHVFPGLAVARVLLADDWSVHWLGTVDRMEATLVPQHGIPIDFIQISGLRGKGLKAIIMAPLVVLRAVWQSKRVIDRIRPDAVLGMGGYVSGPGGLAAKLAGIPIIIHEQNAVAGLTNKWLAKLATQTLQAFPGALTKALVVGNPVRKDIVHLADPVERFIDRYGPIRVLVMGGSQGATILNQVMPSVINQLSDQVIVWHQTGKGAVETVVKRYEQVVFSKSKITEFIDNVAEAYAWADVIICRSGALTVSEIAVVGLAAIFVPFMHRDRQQYFNAKPLEKIGAAVIIEQTDFVAERIIQLLLSWNRSVLLNRAIRAHKLGVTNAAERIATAVKQTVK